MADGDRQSFVQRGERGPREGGNRDAGGFRIRLSDNEMRSARAVQEAFGVRSTVAALGLSLRTVAQLLEEGKLDDVVAQLLLERHLQRPLQRHHCEWLSAAAAAP